MANVLEQLGSPEATPHWRMAHDTLAAMMVAGLFVSAQDQRFLNQLRVKLKP